jgi:hypothetical protein
MALTKAKVSFVEGVDGAVLTGAMPAVDGAALTGISGMTKTTSDPALNTNPATGVGTVWLNKSTSELFGCTDATTDENVWVNIGSGIGPVGKCFGGLGGGTVKGWQMGAAQVAGQQTIMSYLYTSDGNASNVATLANAGGQPTGNSSATHGYRCGGSTNKIEKFTFSSSSNGSDIGTLAMGSSTGGSCSVGSKTHGYICGGYGASGEVSNIDRISYSVDGNSVGVGNLQTSVYHQAGSASATHGYSSGGHAPPAVFVNTRQKFKFGADVSSFYIGDMAQALCAYTTGESSNTHGYISGGVTVSSFNNATADVEKFSFSSDAGSVDVANLTLARIKGSSSSSTTHGYHCGGHTGTGGSGTLNNLDKFTFASDANATDVGDMTAAYSGCASAQY